MARLMKSQMRDKEKEKAKRRRRRGEAGAGANRGQGSPGLLERRCRGDRGLARNPLAARRGDRASRARTARGLLHLVECAARCCVQALGLRLELDRLECAAGVRLRDRSCHRRRRRGECSGAEHRRCRERLGQQGGLHGRCQDDASVVGSSARDADRHGLLGAASRSTGTRCSWPSEAPTASTVGSSSSGSTGKLPRPRSSTQPYDKHHCGLADAGRADRARGFADRGAALEGRRRGHLSACARGRRGGAARLREGIRAAGAEAERRGRQAACGASGQRRRVRRRGILRGCDRRDVRHRAAHVYRLPWRTIDKTLTG